MNDIFKKLTSQKPFVYGLVYLGLIPLYAIIFSLLPETSLKLNDHSPGFISCLYFSVITITTLGYGDITPAGKLGQLLAASESILGVTLIGLFLNSLSHQHGLEVQENERQAQIKKDKEKAIERFSAFNQLIELKINRYKTYTIPITSPVSDRKTEYINENFTFNDMQDLFKTTLRMTDHHFTPAIEYYFESLKELITSIEELIKLGYIQNWSELENLCLEFITTSKNLDFSGHILNQPNTRLGDQKGSDFDVEMIKNHEGAVEFLPSNGINAYVALYFLIQSGFKFIKEYQRLASEVQNG